MAESPEELRSYLSEAVAAGFRERLLDKGLARGLIWRDGQLPPDSPAFPSSLTEDLLDYAHAVMAVALRLRLRDGSTALLERAFLVSAEAIEAATHRGDGSRDSGFQRVTAAVAFHLARYAARAYSILPTVTDSENLAPSELALVRLLRRQLNEMHGAYSEWLFDKGNDDSSIEAKLRDDADFSELDAINLVLTSSFMRGLALFDHAITTGSVASATSAKERLQLTAETARDLNSVTHWWIATLAYHLVDELWKLSLYIQLPILAPDVEGNDRWNNLRLSYIQRLHAAKRSAIDDQPEPFVPGSK